MSNLIVSQKCCVPLSCPYCHTSEYQIKNGKNASGSQKYRCKICNHIYTHQPHGYSHLFRMVAVRLYLEGYSSHTVSNVMKVNHQTVINWANSYLAIRKFSE